MASIDRNTATTQGKRAARAVVRRVRLDPVAALPSQGGALGLRAVFAQARVLVLDGQQYAQGLRLLARLPESALGTTGHGLRAWAHLSLGQLDEATEEAHTVLEIGRASCREGEGGGRDSRTPRDDGEQRRHIE